MIEKSALQDTGLIDIDIVIPASVDVIDEGCFVGCRLFTGCARYP
jgi:hypothetical protein